MSKASGFSKLNRLERYERLIDMGACTLDDIALFQQERHAELDTLLEHWIENSVACYPLPLGVVPELVCDGTARVIPMAVEETSIIAALSKVAKQVNQTGELTTWMEGHLQRGQVYLPSVQVETFQTVFQNKAQHWKEEINAAFPSLKARGGGLEQLSYRILESRDTEASVSIDLEVNTCDAMGANLISQMAESLKEKLHSEALNPLTAIVSNLTDGRLACAKLILREVPPQLGQNIEALNHFARLDSYRASTHNKGIMNGIDAVVMATGNDWRAVEAGVHAYAAQNGSYAPLTDWRYHNGRLEGMLKAPLSVGVVGGMTRLHPFAQWALCALKVDSAEGLSRIMAAVGLLQNLAALSALGGEGIVKGHMRLHLNNLLQAAKASPEEAVILRPFLRAELESKGKISQTDVDEALRRYQKEGVFWGK